MREYDKTLLIVIGTLLATGLFVLASASISLAQQQFGSPFYFIIRQVLFGIGVGSVLFFIGLRIPLRVLKKYALYILFVSIGIQLLVFFPPFGLTLNGASRWVQFGSFSFQPSELLKIAFLIYLSAWLSSRVKDIHTIRYGLMPFVSMLGGVGLLMVLQPDVGTFGVLAITSLVLYAIAGAPLKHVGLVILLGLVSLSLLVASGYRRDRVTALFQPQSDTQGIGYHLDQSLIAIGSGEILGRGFGLSRQKFSYLPEPAGDAIFAVLAEEFGFVGVAILLFLFSLFFLRGMMVASRARDVFLKLLASGITILVATQAIVNIGALSGVVPLTGLPLPFISYGGTALSILLFAVGMLVQISKRKYA